MAELLYHNDGKQKHQSHEVYSKELKYHLDVFLQGYGATKEQAYEEFVLALDEYISRLHEFRKDISIDKTIKIDCFGKPI